MATKRHLEAPSAENEAEAKKLHIDVDQVEALAPGAGLHDAMDEELDMRGMPVGWTACPKMGLPVFRFIPMKVPLGPQFNDFLPRDDQFSVEQAVDMGNEIVGQKTHQVPNPDSAKASEGGTVEVPGNCGMVIDLTNSSRYYNIKAFEDRGLIHVKIPNRGRGEVPHPQAVNDFVFESLQYLNQHPNGYILVHCTHGFNRTGFMIVSYLIRILSDPSIAPEKPITSFAQARPPGIYKNYYIDQLFRYYNFTRPTDMPAPRLPPWKAADSPDRGDDEEAGAEAGPRAGAEGPHLEHDDAIGEAVSKSEADWVRGIMMEYVMDRVGTDPHRTMFPGSQPVSLSRSNLDLLKHRRYWVTWKADGTRYLVLLHRAGTYLVDRSNTVTRVQMRWPLPAKYKPAPAPGQRPMKGPVGPFHVGTILDGEMVVDEDPTTGMKTRRFLAYDCVTLNSNKLVYHPWHQRWGSIKEFVEDPRSLERMAIQKGDWRLPYNYNAEPFRFRAKMFWRLAESDYIINTFIPRKVCHEADGLILQPHDDAYKPLTCEELLKWKFAHMNSVDFRLKVEESGGGKEPALVLQLLHPQPGTRNAVVKDLEGAQVVFPAGESPLHYKGKIIECSWDGQQQAWSFMRERRDKTLPNAHGVYELVVASIKDDIREDNLLQEIKQAVALPPYDEDMGRAPRQQHAQQ